MANGFHVVIPARHDSERLPGKPLVDIGGTPMIVWVAQAAAHAGALDVTVATDDPRIVQAVEAAGFLAELTSVTHQSGSDRVYEVVENRGWSDSDIVLNVQGDEPLLPSEMIAQVGNYLLANPSTRVCTLREAIVDEQDQQDANCVKVVVDKEDRALLFSRAGIPFSRGNYNRFEAQGNYGFRHIGLYGYRVSALQEFVRLPPSPLELQESLEQLRLLENGIDLTVLEACCSAPGGVDTPADLARVRAVVADRSSH